MQLLLIRTCALVALKTRLRTCALKMQQSSQTGPGDAPEVVKNSAPGSPGGAPGDKAKTAAPRNTKRAAPDEPEMRTGTPGSSSAPGAPPGLGGGPGCDPDDPVARQQDQPHRGILVSTAFMWDLGRLPSARVKDILVEALDACYRGEARRLVSMDARLEQVVGQPFTYYLLTPPGTPGDPGRVHKQQDRPERALLVNTVFLYDMRHLEPAEVRSILMGALDASYNDAGEEELGCVHVHADGVFHSAHYSVEPDPDSDPDQPDALTYILQAEEGIVGG